MAIGRRISRVLGRLALACVWLSLSAGSARASSIILVTGPNDATTTFTNVPSSGPLGLAFSTSADFTNVDITLYFASFFTGGTADFDVFLTDQVGPGTTVSDEIASASVSVPIVGSAVSRPYTITPFTVLSGIDLPTGTYYLTWHYTGGTLLNPYSVFSTAGSASVGGDPGSSLVSGYLGSGGIADPIYAPALEFGDLGDFVGYAFWFSVDGTPASTPPSAPEPVSLLLLGTGIVAAGARRLRRGVRG